MKKKLTLLLGVILIAVSLIMCASVPIEKAESSEEKAIAIIIPQKLMNKYPDIKNELEKVAEKYGIKPIKDYIIEIPLGTLKQNAKKK